MSTCPSCGVNTIEADPIIGCQKVWDELAFYTLSLQDDFFLHQVAVDAYAASHSGEEVKPIKTAFALIGLYLLLEKHYTGKEVQLAHMELAKRNKVWPPFFTPTTKPVLTVRDVVNTSEAHRQGKIMEWAQSVWEIWESEHEKVRELAQKYLSYI